MIKAEEIKKAEKAGREAFKAGKKSVPVMDAVIMEMVKTHSGSWDGSVVSILKAWITGWHKENLATEIS